jgi:hypothetical protein
VTTTATRWPSRPLNRPKSASVMPVGRSGPTVFAQSTQRWSIPQPPRPHPAAPVVPTPRSCRRTGRAERPGHDRWRGTALRLAHLAGDLAAATTETAHTAPIPRPRAPSPPRVPRRAAPVPPSPDAATPVPTVAAPPPEGQFSARRAGRAASW